MFVLFLQIRVFSFQFSDHHFQFVSLLRVDLGHQRERRVGYRTDQVSIVQLLAVLGDQGVLIRKGPILAQKFPGGFRVLLGCNSR